jgi:Predicted GTPase, probable translation factor
MKTGIIGLPQVGKTSLFKILTKANIEERGHNPREAHLGVTKVRTNGSTNLRLSMTRAS